MTAGREKGQSDIGGASSQCSSVADSVHPRSSGSSPLTLIARCRRDLSVAATMTLRFGRLAPALSLAFAHAALAERHRDPAFARAVEGVDVVAEMFRELDENHDGELLARVRGRLSRVSL